MSTLLKWPMMALIMLSLVLCGPAVSASVAPTGDVSINVWIPLDEQLIYSTRTTTRGKLPDGEGFADLALKISHYDLSGRLIREKLITDEAAVTSWFYDERGVLIFEAHDLPGSADDRIVLLSEAHPEGDCSAVAGALIADARRDFSGLVTVVDRSSDERGRLIELRTTTRGGELVSREKVLYALDSQGSLTRTYSTFDANGKLTGPTRVETHSPDGLLLSESIVTDGEAVQYLEYSYEFDMNGEWIKRVTTKAESPENDGVIIRVSTREISYW